MTEIFPDTSLGVYLLPLILVLILLVFWLVYRRRGHARSFEGVIKSIAFERISNLIIPNADEGEIQIDHLLLTAAGLLIIDLKEVDGTVLAATKCRIGRSLAQTIALLSRIPSRHSMTASLRYARLCARFLWRGESSTSMAPGSPRVCLGWYATSMSCSPSLAIMTALQPR